MQFVIRGNVIRVMAYRGYDSVKKRAKVELVGTLTLDELTPNDKLLVSLNDKEKLELAHYIQNETIARKKRLIQDQVQNLTGNIDVATTAIRDATYQFNEEEAQTLLLAMEKLTKQLKKSGIIRAKTSKSTSIEKNTD